MVGVSSPSGGRHTFPPSGIGGIFSRSGRRKDTCHPADLKKRRAAGRPEHWPCSQHQVNARGGRGDFATAHGQSHDSRLGQQRGIAETVSRFAGQDAPHCNLQLRPRPVSPPNGAESSDQLNFALTQPSVAAAGSRVRDHRCLPTLFRISAQKPAHLDRFSLTYLQVLYPNHSVHCDAGPQLFITCLRRSPLFPAH